MIERDIIQHAIDALEDDRRKNMCVDDAIHEIFNTDYFMIGYYNCEKWLDENCGAWEAIATVRDYEIDNFGECTTDLSCSEKVCNMYAYIKGEKLWHECETLKNIDTLDEEATKELIEELRGML